MSPPFDLKSTFAASFTFRSLPPGKLDFDFAPPAADRSCRLLSLPSQRPKFWIAELVAGPPNGIQDPNPWRQ